MVGHKTPNSDISEIECPKSEVWSEKSRKSEIKTLLKNRMSEIQSLKSGVGSIVIALICWSVSKPKKNVFHCTVKHIIINESLSLETQS